MVSLGLLLSEDASRPYSSGVARRLCLQVFFYALSTLISLRHHLGLELLIIASALTMLHAITQTQPSTVGAG